MRIERFHLKSGENIASKYEVVRRLGSGWEGEVFLVREKATGIFRTAKFFFPQRNRNNTTAKRHAKKLHSVENSPIVIHYHTHEVIDYLGQPVTCLISDYVRGELLCDFVDRQRGKRLHPYMALHVLHALASGLESLHIQGEYHGDLHTGNIFIRQVGVGFHIKLIDLFDWRDSKKENIKKDVCDLIRVFYDILGGQKYYSTHPPEIRSICCGLKSSLITRKFSNAGFLRQFLENLQWQTPSESGQRE